MLKENFVFNAFVKKSNKNKRGCKKIKCHVKLGDMVLVISGDDKGKIGEVISVSRDKVSRTVKIKVSGVGLVKKAVSKAKHGIDGFKIIEMYIDSSNVALHQRKNFKDSSVLNNVVSSDDHKEKRVNSVDSDSQSDLNDDIADSKSDD